MVKSDPGLNRAAVNAAFGEFLSTGIATYNITGPPHASGLGGLS